MKSSSPDQNLPVLKQFAGFWTLTHQPSAAKEWSMDEKFKQAKKAGFDAMGGGPGPDVVPYCKKYGMDFICYLDGNSRYRERLEAAKVSKRARINVQLCDHDNLRKEAVKIWIKMEAE